MNIWNAFAVCDEGLPKRVLTQFLKRRVKQSDVMVNPCESDASQKRNYNQPTTSPSYQGPSQVCTMFTGRTMYRLYHTHCAQCRQCAD